MTTAAEAVTGKTPLGASLDAGLSVLSLDQVVHFDLYIRVVLPADGFVFWVRAALINRNSAAYNSALYNTTGYDVPSEAIAKDTSFQFKGSLHYASTVQQNEADSATTRNVVFTAREPIDNLEAVQPNTMWIAQHDGMQFAFRERGMFYRQAGLHHYRGQALFAEFKGQLIDSAAMLPTSNIVSNSLPIWLMLNAIAPVYPSFAVPANLAPPYITAHVVPGETRSFAMSPYIDPRTGSSYQLTRDLVRLTLYGLQNNAAIDLQNYIFDASIADDALFGVLNDPMPTIQDEKKTQPEMQILAQRKTFTIAVSYYQTRIQDAALQYILSAFVNMTFSPDIPPP